MRCRQDLNLRGETPLDFKSNALTTRPSQLLQNIKFFIFFASVMIIAPLLKKKKRNRCEQSPNMRGETPLDFKSNALTTRPSQLLQNIKFFYFIVSVLIIATLLRKKKKNRCARGDPIGFQVQRLNHSAITAVAKYKVFYPCHFSIDYSTSFEE